MGWRRRSTLQLVSVFFALAAISAVRFTDERFKDTYEYLLLQAQKRREQIKYLVSRENYTLCGDGYCVCRDAKADCSRTLLALTYIPRLPAGTRELNMSLNLKLSIEQDDAFRNVTNITLLDLSYCSLSQLSVGAFRVLHSLTDLRLAGNNLSYSNFPAFCLPTLERLHLDTCDLGPLPDDVFHTNRLPKLHTLHMGFNHLGPVNMSAFQPLPSLQNLLLDYNQIWHITPAHLPQLQRLSLSMNPLTVMWDTCGNNGSLYPNLQAVFLMETPLSKWDSNLCLPAVDTLVLSSTTFNNIWTNMFSSVRFPSLKSLNLNSVIQGIRIIQAYAFQTPLLTELAIWDNGVDFSSREVDEDSFAGCPGLEKLYINKNDLSRVPSERFLRLFGHLVHLQYLDLSSTDIRNISAGMFSPFTGLKTLVLHSNRITAIPDGAFNSMAPGAKILLQNNQIELVQEAAFSAQMRDNLSVLDLRRNPFRCGCELRWFRDWLAARPSLLQQQDGGVYSCANLPHTDVATFFVADQACLLSRQTSLLVIVTIVIVIVTFSTLSLVFRFRWHLRLVMYEAFRGRDLHQQRLQQRHFDYDVFVSYDSEDTTWVHKHLVPELEDGMQLRLCLHERDFIPGKHIVQNISDCVESSKKVMAIFSSDFARSPWCQFELDMCLSYAVENDDSLLVVLLRDVPPRDLTSAMRAVMKTTTYIEWGHGPDARRSFWRRLHVALAELLPVN